MDRFLDRFPTCLWVCYKSSKGIPVPAASDPIDSYLAIYMIGGRLAVVSGWGEFANTQHYPAL